MEEERLKIELLEARDRIKELEAQNEKLGRDLKRHLAEIQRRKLVTEEILEDQQIYNLEVERVLSLIPSFAKWGAREENKKYNLDLDRKLNHGDPIERVKNLYKLLEEAIPKYRNHFDAGLKIKSQEKKEQTKKTLTPLEKKLYNFCKKKDIDLTASIGKIHFEAEEKGFRNLKGKNEIARSIVGRMLVKIRPQ